MEYGRNKLRFCCTFPCLTLLTFIVRSDGCLAIVFQSHQCEVRETGKSWENPVKIGNLHAEFV